VNERNVVRARKRLQKSGARAVVQKVQMTQYLLAPQSNNKDFFSIYCSVDAAVRGAHISREQGHTAEHRIMLGSFRSAPLSGKT
jgi:hypothetical protein